MLLIPNALCWSSESATALAHYPQKSNCACALPAEVGKNCLRVKISEKFWWLRRRSCVHTVNNRGRLEIATSAILWTCLNIAVFWVYDSKQKLLHIYYSIKYKNKTQICDVLNQNDTLLGHVWNQDTAKNSWGDFLFFYFLFIYLFFYFEIFAELQSLV